MAAPRVLHFGNTRRRSASIQVLCASVRSSPAAVVTVLAAATFLFPTRLTSIGLSVVALIIVGHLAL